MRRLQFLFLALLSFLAVTCHSFLYRTVALTLCAILGIESSSGLLLSDAHATAAQPPTHTQIAQIDLFNPNPTPNNAPQSPPPADLFSPGSSNPTPSNSSPNVDIFAPSRSQNSPSNRSNEALYFAREGITFKEVDRKIYEISTVTPNKCQITRTINALTNKPYISIISFKPLEESCKTGSWMFNFKPDRQDVEVKFTETESLLIEFISTSTARVIYKEASRQETYDISYKKKVRLKGKQATELNLSSSNEKSLNKVFSKALSIPSTKYSNSPSNKILIADSGDNFINSLGCNICKLFKPIQKAFGDMQKLDDALSVVASLPASLSALVWRHAAPEYIGSIGQAAIRAYPKSHQEFACFLWCSKTYGGLRRSLHQELSGTPSTQSVASGIE